MSSVNRTAINRRKWFLGLINKAKDGNNSAGMARELSRYVRAAVEDLPAGEAVAMADAVVALLDERIPEGVPA